jgi:hypothetical protein
MLPTVPPGCLALPPSGPSPGRNREDAGGSPMDVHGRGFCDETKQTNNDHHASHAAEESWFSLPPARDARREASYPRYVGRKQKVGTAYATTTYTVTLALVGDCFSPGVSSSVPRGGP